MSFRVVDGRVQEFARWPCVGWRGLRPGDAQQRFQLNIALADGASRVFSIIGFELPVRIGDDVTLIADAAGRQVLAEVNHSTVDGANYLREEAFWPVRVGDLLALPIGFVVSVALWSSAGATWFALGGVLYLVGARALRGWLRRWQIAEVDCAISRAAREFA